MATRLPLPAAGPPESLQELDRTCRQIVRELRNRPGYGFLEEETLAARLRARVSQAWAEGRTARAGLREQVLRAAKSVYAEALYQGCRSSGAPEQNRAYEELGHFLYRVAFHYVSTRGFPAGLAEECAQEALLQIHRHIRNVEQPGWFLHYAIRTVTRECSRAMQRAAERGGDAEPPVELATGPALLASATGTREMLDCLLQAMARLPNRDWRVVLILEHFAGLDDAEIARVLGTTSGNVQVMRHRALKRLRADPQLGDCLQGG